MKNLPKEKYCFPVEVYGVNSCEAVGWGIENDTETIFLNLKIASTRTDDGNIVLMVHKDLLVEMLKQINESIKDLTNA